ncbi:FtsK/SpoIIIE family protein [Stackebrandtia albiflava]|uniref:FtsK/SpoIIIE family protein n=1 Tax=Stackebrandtia albiflava TaxID=406432 RepID=A0A562V1B3_9ACTN|nr:FtsK/SpoIIIE domain-containing protein [Stackebrandtia albiflava]TWJ11587.1 FtsK/SpoIIIE family protein [Stackebrandtia albiflava]
MPGLRATFDQAVTRHLSAVARLAATRAVLDTTSETGPAPEAVAAETVLGQRLRAAADTLRREPGWVRIGEGRLHEGGFPVMVPFPGHAHLRLSADAGDPRVAGLVRSVLLQTLATRPPGTRVLAVDTETVGAAFAPLRPLMDAGVLAAPATDQSGFTAALAAAEGHVKANLLGDGGGELLLVIASAPALPGALADRLAALARSGSGSGLRILAAGVPELPDSVDVTVGDVMRVGNPPNAPFGMRDGLAVPVVFDPPQPTDYLTAESQRLADRARAAAELGFADLIPPDLWREDPADGLATVIGRDAQGVVSLRFDDETPHWLIGGRTGGGKTVFLLDVLYGLAARYAPQDLALYLLDFKEGVSFTEFTPQPSDPTYIPHAKAVGVESDREYGVAILRELDAEMTRRSVVMKRHGVARYGQLRVHERLPRIVCFIDEFQVLFAGNDRLAREAVAVLENLARKGRSYGVHLVLASQTTSGIEALYTKRDSIFGQFGMRVALPGATSVLDGRNTAAQNLRTGEAVINVDGGVAGRDRRIRFPNAHADTMTLFRLRHDMWERRGEAPAPTVFYGYAEVTLEEQPEYGALVASDPPEVLLGRRVDASLRAASVRLDRTPGRHVAVLGSDRAGAQTLAAAARSLARQQPTARYVIAGLAEPGAVESALAGMAAPERLTDPDAVARVISELADHDGPAYLIGFGLDLVTLDRTGQADLRRLLRRGPGNGVHLLGWWRSLRRFMEDIGGTSGREDVACNLVLNIPGDELMNHFGQSAADWRPRPGRALLLDRQAGTQDLLVPFTAPDRT